MARLKDTVVPLADYPSGVHQLGPFTVSNQAVKVGFEFARCTTADPTIWPNASTTIYFRTELSLDNGQTWTMFGGGGAVGGIHVNKDGTEAPFSYYGAQLPAGNNRRLRVNVEITDGPLRTYGNIVVTTA